MIGLVGSLSRDRFLGRAGYAVGGGAFHGARALRRLDALAVVATRCADAHRSDLLPPLEALGVPVRWNGGERTATFAISYEGDVRTMEIDALGDPWTAADARGWVADALAGAEWLHVAPLARSDFDAETLRTLARGRRLSLDGQGLVRVPTVGPLRLDADFDPRLLERVSILKLSEEEAAVLGDVAALPVAEIVVTYGSQGATVHAGGRSEHVGTDPVESEPTGAGDAFSVAYLLARSQGAEPVEAARRATVLVAELLCG